MLFIFETDGERRLKWQQRLEYIMIDEYQDIDELQVRLMKVLCAYHKNLFIVGDPDQTIYTWRGASVRYILNFDKEFSDVRTIPMMDNYRSTPQILAAANSLIGKNKNRIQKDLVPTLPDGVPVVYHHARTSEAEAKWIAFQIRELADKGVAFGDVTVLYRAHYKSRTLEEVFLKEELPYTIYSGAQFYGRMEIKDALSYLRLVAYRDDLSFLRVANTPKRNIGERRMKYLREYAAENRCSLYQALERSIDNEVFRNTKAKQFLALVERLSLDFQNRPVSELLNDILDRSGYEEMLRMEGSQERLDNLAELKQSVYEYETLCGEESTLESYLSHVAVLSNTDTVSGKNTVKLMTVHTAKGLEFPCVFLCGMEAGVFPSKKTSTLEEMEEERRLAFVAFTRAETALFMSDAEGRNLDGSCRYPSRFIFNVDKSLLAYTGELDAGLVDEANRSIRSSERTLDLARSGFPFKPGDRIVHSVMGAGEIVEIDRDKSAYAIRFDGLETLRSISVRARLEAEGGPPT